MKGAVKAAVEKRDNNGKHSIDFSYLIAAARDGVLDLEQAADAILAAEGALGNKTGIYTQAQIERKMRVEQRRLQVVDEGAIRNDTIEYLLQCQVDNLVDVSRLTPIQEICYRLHIDGLTCRDISTTLHLKFHTTANHLRSARKKVRAAVRDGKYAGWYEVYISEVNRHGHRSSK